LVGSLEYINKLLDVCENVIICLETKGTDQWSHTNQVIRKAVRFVKKIERGLTKEELRREKEE
jgi:hypothetical protein